MASAYIKDDQGGTFIPASQRPDGTWRKPRRVKDGYVPQEEVPLYESKGKQFIKNKPTCPVGLTPEFIAAHKAKKEAQAAKNSPIPGLIIQNASKKKKKKNKNKSVEALSENLEKTSISEPDPSNQKQLEKTKSSTTNSIEKETTAQPNMDPAKRLRNLRRKIREIEVLAQKIKTGEIKNPDKEMLEKVSRKTEIEKEIKQLEAKSIDYSLY